MHLSKTEKGDNVYLNEPGYLIHYGKKGAKWGYSGGVANGKRTAGQSKNDGGKPEEEEDEKEEVPESGKYENGLDKSKYTRIKLKNGKYLYKLKKEYKDWKKKDSLDKTTRRLGDFNPGRDSRERDKRWNTHVKKLQEEEKKKKEELSKKTNTVDGKSAKESSKKTSIATNKTPTSSTKKSSTSSSKKTAGIRYGTSDDKYNTTVYGAPRRSNGSSDKDEEEKKRKK